jgi:hypothetical protein
VAGRQIEAAAAREFLRDGSWPHRPNKRNGRTGNLTVRERDKADKKVIRLARKHPHAGVRELAKLIGIGEPPLEAAEGGRVGRARRRPVDRARAGAPARALVASAGELRPRGDERWDRRRSLWVMRGKLKSKNFLDLPAISWTRMQIQAGNGDAQIAQIGQFACRFVDLHETIRRLAAPPELAVEPRQRREI